MTVAEEESKPINQFILGHTNASFTLDTYTHVTTDMQKKASGIVGSFLDEIM